MSSLDPRLNTHLKTNSCHENEKFIREKLFLSLEDDDIEVRLTKLEMLLEELKKSDSEKEAV